MKSIVVRISGDKSLCIDDIASVLMQHCLDVYMVSPHKTVKSNCKCKPSSVFHHAVDKYCWNCGKRVNKEEA